MRSTSGSHHRRKPHSAALSSSSSSSSDSIILLPSGIGDSSLDDSDIATNGACSSSARVSSMRQSYQPCLTSIGGDTIDEEHSNCTLIETRSSLPPTSLRRQSKVRRPSRPTLVLPGYRTILTITFVLMLGLLCIVCYISDKTSNSHKIFENATWQQPLQPRATVAYAISITGCDGTLKGFIDSALVLQHSIHLNSIHNSPASRSQYSYQMYAFIHPDAVTCSEPYWSLLNRSNYKILVRDTPFQVADIQNQFLREHIHTSGCCGEKEFLKLYVNTLTNHPIAVHLDVDTIVLQPLDDLFDCMLDTNSDPSTTIRMRRKLHIMNGTSLPLHTQPIQAFFTRDYNMVNPGQKNVGVQGGFIVLRPNLTVLEEQIKLILTASFRFHKWDGKYGGYYGDLQVQGFWSYYYDGLHPHTAVELDYCIYDNMAKFPSSNGTCLGPPNVCQDCRQTDIGRMKLAHFTDECVKPFKCHPHKEIDLCHNLTKAWFSIRRDYEYQQLQPPPSNATQKDRSLASPTCVGTYNEVEFLGCCKWALFDGYLPLSI